MPSIDFSKYQTNSQTPASNTGINFSNYGTTSPQKNSTGSPTDQQLQQNQANDTSNSLGLTSLGRTVLKPVVGFGNSIAGALSNILPKSWTGVGNVEKSQTDYTKDTMNLVNLIKDRRSRGMDTSSLETALKNEVTPAQWKDLYPSITKNAKQVVGEAAGTGLLALSGGGLSAGGAAESGVLAASKAAIPSLTRTIAAGATYGAVGGASNAMQDNKSGGNIAKDSLIGAGIGAAAGGAAYGFGKLLESAGNKVLNVAIKPSLADTQDGFSIDTIKKYDLGGSLSTINTKTQNRLNDLTQQLRTKLSDSDATIDLADVYDKTVSDISSNQMKTFGSNTSMDNAIEQLQNEVLKVNPSGKISIPDAQLVKQGAGGMGAWQFNRTDPDATARESVYNAFYKNIKQAIEDGSPDGVKEINKQISELIPVANAVIRRIPVAARNSSFSLPQIVALASGIVNPHTLPITVAAMGQAEGSVGNILSKYAGPAIINQSAKVGAATGFGTSRLQ